MQQSWNFDWKNAHFLFQFRFRTLVEKTSCQLIFFEKTSNDDNDDGDVGDKDNGNNNDDDYFEVSFSFADTFW